MWAGGSFTFSADARRALRVGETVTQRNVIRSVDFKSDMIFVNQQRDLFRGDVDVSQLNDGWAVQEIRTHVFRREVGKNEAIRAKAKRASLTALAH